MNFLKINMITLHYEVTGQANGKPVLVFANSLGTDFRIWDDIAASLADTFTLVRYDKRGHGLSSLGNPPYAMDDHVGDLIALLDHLVMSEVIVCGLSVGGLIAQRLYQLRPDLVKALILCDTGHKIGTVELWQERIDALESHGLEPMVEAVMERWFTASFRREDNPAFVGCRNMFARQDTRGYAGTCAAIRDTDLTEQAKLIAVPTLCVVGDQDLATPIDLVKELSELIANAELEIIENAGHIPCVEQPKKLAKIIRDFAIKTGQEIKNG